MIESKKIIVGIDEMTIVIKVSPEDIFERGWVIIAKELIKKVENKLKFSDLWKDGIVMQSRVPSGYNVGIMYGEERYLICLAYNTDRSDMGLVIKMSASGLSYYKKTYYEKYGVEIQEYEIIKNLDSIKGMVRLSRVDCYADYINTGVSVDTIYSELKTGKTEIRYVNGRKNISRLSSYENDSVVNTFYVGTRVKNTKGILRVYNKKKEQIDNYGIRYYDAVSYDDWVRVEAQYMGSYAHSFTEALRNCNSQEELVQLIASSIIDRYSFFDTVSDEYHYITKALDEMILTQTIAFSSPSPRDASLKKTFNYIIDGSGLMSLLYKVKKIYGEDGVNYLFGLIIEAHEDYEPNEDAIYWLEKYLSEYMEYSIEEVITRE